MRVPKKFSPYHQKIKGEQMDLSRSITVSKRIHFKYEWKIHNFETCILKDSTSPPFIVEKYGKTEWHIEFHEQKDEKLEFIGYSLFLHVRRRNSQKFKINLKLGIIDSNWNFLHLYQNESELKAANGTATFVSHYQLYEQREKYVPGGTLMIGCEMTLIGPPTSSAISIDIPPCKLSDDFGGLLDSGANADVTLTVGDRKFNAHKLILMARSSVFTEMLKNSMPGSSVEIVEIEDLTAETVEKVLEFIYTGKVNDLEDSALYLLNAANKYDLKRLKVMCESSIYNSINIENAEDILALANRYEADHLKVLVRDFIDNHDKEIRDTESSREAKRARTK